MQRPEETVYELREKGLFNFASSKRENTPTWNRQVCLGLKRCMKKPAGLGCRWNQPCERAAFGYFRKLEWNGRGCIQISRQAFGSWDSPACRTPNNQI